MASYKSGFDPPTRPETGGRRMRVGHYVPPPQTKQLEEVRHREADMAHISGQMERRGYPPTRPQQTGLPRPNMQDSRSRSEPQVRVGTGSRFGFGRSTQATKDVPELKGKSSRNVLRRKPSSIAQNAEAHQGFARSISSSPTKWMAPVESRPSIDSSLRSAEAYNDIFTRSRRAPTALPTELPKIIPELDRYRTAPDHQVPYKLSTQDLPPPTPLLSGVGTPVYSAGSHHRYSGYSGSGYSGSPSTRFSESPGPGAYSRDTTPTSQSSMSPGISVIAPLKTPSRVRQGSPAVNRPPVTMRGRSASGSATETSTEGGSHEGLPALRESLTSSSSNSTVKGEGKGKDSSEKKKRKKRLSPLPPSPPPRKSSQKFKKDNREEQESPSKPSQAPAKPVMESPVRTRVVSPAESSPIRQRLISPSEAPVRPIVPSRPMHYRKTSNPPPARPSREGTPDLQTQLGDINLVSPSIIQSNLNSLPVSLPTDRRRSALPKISASSPLQHQLPSPGFRRNSPSPALGFGREGTPAPPSGLGIIPDLRPRKGSSTGTRTPSPSITNSKPRFGLFGRRTKTTTEVPTVETKVPRKGPAAGTGHEGYGRYAIASRGRSASAGGLGRGSGRDRSTSAASSGAESTSSTRTHDPFLLQRMSPVIIAGGGEILENRNASSDSLSTALTRPSLDSKKSEPSRTTLWPSAFPRDTPKRQSAIAPMKGRRPSDSSDDGIGKSSLAFRRSMQRLNDSATALHLPRPLNMSKLTGPGSMTSLEGEMSILSDESQPQSLDTQDSSTRGRKLVKKEASKKLEKRAVSPYKSQSRKWNFFHREKSAKPEVERKGTGEVQVTVGKAPAKSIPHYALLDSSDEQMDTLEIPDLEDILHDADVVDLSNEELDLLQFGRHPHQRENPPVPQEAKVEQRHMLEVERPVIFSSPEPMPATPEPIQVELSVERPLLEPQTSFHLDRQAAPTPPRPSRLPQVGRIPKVVSARPETTSPKSFSRPFARLSTIQPLQVQKNAMMDKESVAKGADSSPEKPNPVKLASIELQQVNDQARRPPTLRESSGDSIVKTNSSASERRDFLAFSPRKNSEATTSSSGGMSGISYTAVIPEPGAELVEDEVWDEYDDLIANAPGGKDVDGDETVKVPDSASSEQNPFQYESYESRRLRKSKMIEKAKEYPTLTQTPVIKDLANLNVGVDARRSGLTSSSIYSADMSNMVKDILAVPQTPTTPMSFTDFFSGYGDRNNSTPGDSAHKPRNSTSPVFTREERKSSSPPSNNSHSRSHSRNLSGLLTIPEAANTGSAANSPISPISQVNLRVGSMTVSKWLTFGHVLFSPAREAILSDVPSSSKRSSILVIDGLGNDDWSFYAAETYPNSTFYNLSQTPAPNASVSVERDGYKPKLPENHRQVQHPALSIPTKFPFASNTFTLLILRFPPSLSQAAYTHLISEARRVLKPGGYIELAILDLDWLSMGNRARRAVRSLKVRMQVADPSLVLGSASDAILGAVGRKGFVGLRRAGVGVPVSGVIPNSQLNAQAMQGSEGEEMSLADLMKDPTSKSDENITKMVAKVGRWWYTRCYESVVLPNGGMGEGEIFADEKLLEECEKWGASFKLTVAYAMKPSLSSEGGRRRGMSL